MADPSGAKIPIRTFARAICSENFFGFTQIKQAAKQHNRSTVDFVVGVLKRYLAGNRFDEPLGLCPTCRRRAASLPSPHTAPGEKEGKVKVKAKEKAAKPEAEAPQPATCKCGLRYHPGCSTRSGQHNHGPWWPREKCNDSDCAKRTVGWKLAEINATKRRDGKSTSVHRGIGGAGRSPPSASPRNEEMGGNRARMPGDRGTNPSQRSGCQ